MIRYFGYAAYLERIRHAAGAISGIPSRHAPGISRLRAADRAGAGIRARARRTCVRRSRRVRRSGIRRVALAHRLTHDLYLLSNMHAEVSGISRQVVNHSGLLIGERVLAASGRAGQTSSQRGLIGRYGFIGHGLIRRAGPSLAGRGAVWAALI